MARPDVSKERKKQILDAASLVFTEKGFHKARMDDIAKTAGLSKGSLYWYFKSKDEVIYSLLEDMYGIEIQFLESLLEGEGSPLERLQLFCQQYMAYVEANQDILPVTYEYYSASARNEDFKQLLKRYFRTFRRLLTELIQQGIDQEEFRKVDPEATAITLSSVAEGLCILWVMDSENVSLAKMGETAFHLLLHGLQETPKKEP